MKRSMVIRVVVAVVVVVFAAGILLQGGEFDLGWLKYFSAAVLVATLVLGLWDIWLWRLPLIQRIAGVPRNIRGTWKGTLTSFWVNPDTGARPDPKTVFMVIHQTGSSVSVRLYTDESRSASSIADISAVDGTFTLTYLYLNKPDMRVEHRSRIHHGSTALDISGCPARRLQGRYWTDRDSKGELDFGKWHGRLAENFGEAQSMF